VKVIRTVADMGEEALAIIRSSKSYGFVPTMGALHEGHVSLIRRAANENDIVAVSIFVNPTQFNENDDFEKYPRNIEADLALAEEAGADIVFNPEPEDMFSDKRDTLVMPNKLTNHLCGLSRGKGHFIGVCTVVSKLFNIIRPEKAYFGQKDAQQALIIQRMVHDLNFPVKIEICPIIREDDGLALSSRNVRIPENMRHEALSLSRALTHGKALIEDGATNAPEVINAMCEKVIEAGDVEIDYIDIVSTETLEDVAEIDDLVLLAGAIKVGGVRLIDNMLAAPAGK